jgi:hypothetical protein
MNERTKTVINNNIIEQANNFNYLGYTITASNNRYLEIKRNRFKQMCSTIRTLNKTRKDTQIKLYKTIAVPTHTRTYGSEIWTIRKKQEAKIKTAEMKFLRTVAGYTREGPNKKY